MSFSDFLKSNTANRRRGVTLACAAIAIVFSVGAGVSQVKGVVKEAENEFSASVEPSLNNISSAANGLTSVLTNYPEAQAEMTDLRTARNALIDADDTREKTEAYRDITEAFNSAYEVVDTLNLDDTTLRNASAYKSSFDTAVNGIAASDYNELAENAASELSGPLAKAYMGIAGVSIPEVME